MNSSIALANQEPQKKPRVLLVDSDEVGLLQASIALQERGFSITKATSGARALAALGSWRPDIVVLDAMMPGMDGFQICRTLRRRPRLQSLPVLMLTGPGDDAIDLAFEAGATDFFVKSSEWRLLGIRLRHLLHAAQTQFELERCQSRLARVLDVAGMGSFDWKRGAGSSVFAVNCLRVFGLSPHEPLGFRRVLRMLPKRSRAGLLAMLRKVLDHSLVLAIDVPVTLPDGRQRSAQLGYTGIVQDVTARRMAEGKISRLVNFDERTGLPNRHQLIWRTERALEFARRHNHQVSLLHIDLDRFKIINDALDHGAGAELFNEVSRRLRSCVRHFDQVMDGSRRAMGNRSHRTLEAVGHYGDKFVALLPEVLEERDAERVASRILDLMREPIVVDDLECFVTASVGIAMFPRDGTSVADLLRNAADRAATHRGEHTRQWNHQRRTEATRAIGA